MIKNYLSKETLLIYSLLLYFLGALLFYPFLKYQINPDGIIYMNIADYYFKGDYIKAINGYWSPLISWLIIPLLWMGFNTILAVKTILILVGAGIIVQSNLLMKKIELSRKFQGILLFLIVFITLSKLFIITPDLLFLFFSLVLINIIFHPQYAENKYSGILIGLTGAFIYFSKGFGFSFFIASCLFIHVLFFVQLKLKRKQLIKHYAIGMIIFLCLSTIWILVMTGKFGEVTISQAGIYNSELREYSKNDNLSINYLPKIIIGQLERSMRNTFVALDYLNRFSLFFSSILVGTFFLLFSNLSDVLKRKLACLLGITGLLLFGYILLWVEQRYIWLSIYLTVILGGKILEFLFQRIISLKKIQLIITALFGISFLLQPIGIIVSQRSYLNQVGVCWNEIKNLPIEGSVVTNDNSIILYTGYKKKLNLIRLVDAKLNQTNEIEIKNKIKKMGYDYFVIKKPVPEALQFLSDYEIITNGETKNFIIYKLN